MTRQSHSGRRGGGGGAALRDLGEVTITVLCVRYISPVRFAIKFRYRHVLYLIIDSCASTYLGLSNRIEHGLARFYPVRPIITLICSPAAMNLFSRFWIFLCKSERRLSDQPPNTKTFNSRYDAAPRSIDCPNKQRRALFWPLCPAAHTTHDRRQTTDTCRAVKSTYIVVRDLNGVE